MKRYDENHSFNMHVCLALKGHIQKAILLKELYGWCVINAKKKHNIRDGKVWSYMSAEGFEAKFPYMALSSIARWLKELERDGWIISANYNQKSFDRTKWYTVNFAAYDAAISHSDFSISQNENCISQNEVTIPPTTTTTTNINNNVDSNESDDSPLKYQNEFDQLISCFQSVTGRKLKVPTTKTALKTYSHYKVIKARLNKGATVEDCKTVISAMCDKWANDDYMKKYRRLKTLLGANFDEYLEEAMNEPSPRTDDQPQDLEAYILTHYREKDLKHMKKDGSFDRWSKQLQENSFKIANIAKPYKNKHFTPMFVFECAFMPLGGKLGGSKPDRKIDSLIRWFKKLSDYNQNQGDLRQLLKEYNARTL